MKELYLDGEWFIGGKMFLIGFCYETGPCIQLHHKSLSLKAFQSILKQLSPGAKIYFYGPDIGMLEKKFKINLRQKYYCVNLLKVFNKVLPPGESRKLAHVEKSFGIVRKRNEFKKNIFEIYSAWRDTRFNSIVLEYNKEDVINLRRLKRKVFSRYGINSNGLPRLQ